MWTLTGILADSGRIRLLDPPKTKAHVGARCLVPSARCRAKRAKRPDRAGRLDRAIRLERVSRPKRANGTNGANRYNRANRLNEAKKPNII